MIPMAPQGRKPKTMTATAKENRIVKAFADLRAAGKKALLPFITAGYPDLETTEALLHELAARGVRVCELGIPFSDPVADGPVIQASYTQALAGGVTSEKILDTVRRFRTSTTANTATAASELAIIAMVSYSIVFRRNVEQFVAQAAQAGIDGLIIPDLPLDEAAAMEQLTSAAGLCNIMLIAPTTPPARRLEIARHSRGFVYFVSIAGITGERDRLPQPTIDAVADLRRQIDTPVCVGFGIAKAQTVEQVCKVADGAIVGSAIVHHITDAVTQGLPRAQLVRQVGEFVSELTVPIR